MAQTQTQTYTQGQGQRARSHSRSSSSRTRDPREDADEVMPGVWISGWEVALNGEWLARHKIGAVFNCTKEVPFHPYIAPLHQYRIPVDDNLQPIEIKHMEQWAPEIAFFILREHTAGRPLLIHCHAGIQRSTTACAFFMMALTQKPLIQVMYAIQSRRTVAFRHGPNFAAALRSFEEQVRGGLRAS